MSKALVCFSHRSSSIGEHSFLVLFLTCLPHQQLLAFSQSTVSTGHRSGICRVDIGQVLVTAQTPFVISVSKGMMSRSWCCLLCWVAIILIVSRRRRPTEWILQRMTSGAYYAFITITTFLIVSICHLIIR